MLLIWSNPSVLKSQLAKLFKKASQMLCGVHVCLREQTYVNPSLLSYNWIEFILNFILLPVAVPASFPKAMASGLRLAAALLLQYQLFMTVQQSLKRPNYTHDRNFLYVWVIKSSLRPSWSNFKPRYVHVESRPHIFQLESDRKYLFFITVLFNKERSEIYPQKTPLKTHFQQEESTKWATATFKFISCLHSG